MGFNFLHDFKDYIYSIGYFSEFTTFIITSCLIFRQHIYFIFYVIMVLLSKLINQILKKIIKDPRPNKPIKFLESEKFGGKNFGMPSGHSQFVFFTTVYNYLVIKQFIPWTLLLLVIGLITIYERYIFKNHTLSQLIVGAFVGGLLAYLTYYLATYTKDKLLEERKSNSN